LLPHSVRRAMQQTMDEHVGVLRSQASLNLAVSKLSPLSAATGAKSCTEDWETTNIHALACVLTRHALLREETRGSHWREDFPERDDARWQTRLVTSIDENGALHTRTEPIGGPE
jgi:L-aspartate oxidase